MDWASEIAKGCGDGVGWGGGNGFVRRNWLPMKVWEGARVWAGEVPSRGGRVWVLYLSSNSGLRAEGRLRGSWIETYLKITCRTEVWWETKDVHFPKSDYNPVAISVETSNQHVPSSYLFGLVLFLGA